MTVSEEKEYVDLLTAHQGRLFGYAYSQLTDPEGAREVLQETNLVLWRKREEFTLGTSFWAWAQRTAHFQTLAYRQKKGRDRLVFDEDVTDMLEAIAARVRDVYDPRKEMLESCIQKLDEKYRRMINRRYKDGISVNDVAKEESMPANTVAQALFRVRKKLIDCVKSLGNG